MSNFKDREKAFENKMARDEEVEFRITARRNKLVGQWAAAMMNMSPDETEAYSKEVVLADFEEAGDEDVIRKVLSDLVAAGVDADDAKVRAALEEKMTEARRQFTEENS